MLGSESLAPLTLGGTTESRVEDKQAGPPSWTDPPNGDQGYKSRGSVVGVCGQLRGQNASEY